MLSAALIWIFVGFLLWLQTPRSWLALVVCMIVWPFFLIIGIVEILKDLKGG